MVRDNEALLSVRTQTKPHRSFASRFATATIVSSPCFSFLAGLALCAFAAPADDLILSISGDRFAVNGNRQFLVFVAYFDALRAADPDLEADFAELRSFGVDGIRVFPNWWNWADRSRFPDDTLMDADGNLRPERLAKLETVLNKAKTHGLVVDVSFAYETVAGLSSLRDDQLALSQAQLPVNEVRFERYRVGLERAARALMPYRHIFFDVQNEYNGRITHLSDEQVRELVRAIKAADPKRIVTASLANEIGPEEVAKRSESVGLDVIAWHESRNPWAYDELDALVRRVKSRTTKPVYLGEPAYMGDEFTVEQFVTAVSKAQHGGAAAWTLHTQNSFELCNRRLFDALSEREKEFLRRIKAQRPAMNGGAAAR